MKSSSAVPGNNVVHWEYPNRFLLVVTILVSCLGGSQYGYSLGVLNLTEPVKSSFLSFKFLTNHDIRFDRIGLPAAPEFEIEK